MTETIRPMAEQYLDVSLPARWIERQAAEAVLLVGLFVGVPAAVAAGAVLVLFVLNVVVLLAPVVAIALTWVAWRANR